MKTTDSIEGWHAHVYFAPAEMARARALCEAVRDRFGVAMGHMHEAQVGPHPTGSCQLTVPAAAFGEVAAWLALNRDGLDVFCHAETGDAMADHTRHVVWIGRSHELRIDVLERLLARR